MDTTNEEVGLMKNKSNYEIKEVHGRWVGLCPRCGNFYDKPYIPALSRKDNKTYVCSDCGVAEAMLDFTKTKDGLWATEVD